MLDAAEREGEGGSGAFDEKKTRAKIGRLAALVECFGVKVDKIVAMIEMIVFRGDCGGKYAWGSWHERTEWFCCAVLKFARRTQLILVSCIVF